MRRLPVPPAAPSRPRFRRLVADEPRLDREIVIELLAPALDADVSAASVR